MATAPEAQPALPRAYLRTCLLLLLHEGPSHGYELLEAVQGLGLRAAEAGGLYRTLRAMDEDGEVRSWWEPSEAGPARRTYAITPAGERALVDSVTAAEAVAGLLHGLVRRYRQPAAPAVPSS